MRVRIAGSSSRQSGGAWPHARRYAQGEQLLARACVAEDFLALGAPRILGMFQEALDACEPRAIGSYRLPNKRVLRKRIEQVS